MEAQPRRILHVLEADGQLIEELQNLLRWNGNLAGEDHIPFPIMQGNSQLANMLIDSKKEHRAGPPGPKGAQGNHAVRPDTVQNHQVGQISTSRKQRRIRRAV
jgi:hypothetical protein